MNVDPVASMRQWEIEISLNKRTFVIPPVGVADWWQIIRSGDLSRLLDFVESAPDDPDNLDELLLSGRAEADELTQVLTDATEEACGRSLRAASVLVAMADHHWPIIGGALAMAGFRWSEQSIGTALDAVYAAITSRLEGDPLAKFLALLENEDERKARAAMEFVATAGPRPTSGAVATAERSGDELPRTRPRSRPRHLAGRSALPRSRRAQPAGSGPHPTP